MGKRVILRALSSEPPSVQQAQAAQTPGNQPDVPNVPDVIEGEFRIITDADTDVCGMSKPIDQQVDHQATST